jgi:hypothetical protein
MQLHLYLGGGGGGGGQLPLPASYAYEIEYTYNISLFKLQLTGKTEHIIISKQDLFNMQVKTISHDY